MAMWLASEEMAKLRREVHEAIPSEVLYQVLSHVSRRQRAVAVMYSLAAHLNVRIHRALDRLVQYVRCAVAVKVFTRV